MNQSTRQVRSENPLTGSNITQLRVPFIDGGAVLRLWYIPLVAFLPQILLIWMRGSNQVSDALFITTLVLTFVLLFAFVISNFGFGWVRLIGLGVALNFLVIVSNGGYMPISPEAFDRVAAPEYVSEFTAGDKLPYSKDILLETGDTALWWLSDTLVVPWFPSSNIAISIGDLFIAAGLVYLAMLALVHGARVATGKNRVYKRRPRRAKNPGEVTYEAKS